MSAPLPSYDFDTIHPRRGTGSIKWDRRPELDPFWVADMDFPSPPAVIEALRKRVDHGIFGYAQPQPSLEESIVAYYSKRHGVSIKEDQLVHLGGLVPALSLAGRAFGEPGQGYITCTPVYPPFLNVHKDHGLTLKTIPHVRDNGRWTFDWDQLEKSIGPEDRIFLLTHPQNPLGRVFSNQEILRLGEICSRHKLVLVSDEVHCDLVLDEKRTPFFSALHLPKELQDRLVVLNSPSKVYNVAGLAYAYAVIPNDSLRRKFTQAKGHMLPELNPLSYHAAEAAYRHGEDWRQALLAYLRGNRDLISSFAAEHLPGVVIPEIEATYLAWMDFRPTRVANPAETAEKEAGLFISDGSFFGAPGHTRVNFGCPRSSLQDALERLAGILGS